MNQSLLTRRIGRAARFLTIGNPDVVVKAEDLQRAARFAKLELSEPLERDPVAIAVGVEAVTRIELMFVIVFRVGDWYDVQIARLLKCGIMPGAW